MGARSGLEARRINIFLVAAVLAAALAVLASSIPPASAGARVNYRFADLDGLRIYYEIHGQGNETMLMLHGWACNHSFWEFQTPQFAETRQVIVMDLPGHGRSDRPRLAYTPELFADAVAAVLDDAGVDQAVLIGHSMGVSILRRFIRNHPTRTSHLIDVDGGFIHPPRSVAEWTQDMAAWAEEAAAVLNEDIYAQWLPGFIAQLFSAKTTSILRQEIMNRMTATPQYVGASALMFFLLPVNWLDESPLDVPTLALASPYTVESLGDTEEYVRELFPGSSFRYWSENGHFLMMEDPSRFNQTVERYLTEDQ